MNAFAVDVAPWRVSPSVDTIVSPLFHLFNMRAGSQCDSRRHAAIFFSTFVVLTKTVFDNKQRL
ncbi:hypothetical protein KCP71_11005 [Salmonella enterica subsp. enterica]|nr:hypothetical protein KCP71_11005 [Salmonella enterica subsp. enterica]